MFCHYLNQQAKVSPQAEHANLSCSSLTEVGMLTGAQQVSGQQHSRAHSIELGM
jgi:hypothetical protein